MLCRSHGNGARVTAGYMDGSLRSLATREKKKEREGGGGGGGRGGGGAGKARAERRVLCMISGWLTVFSLVIRATGFLSCLLLNTHKLEIKLKLRTYKSSSFYI